MNGLERRKIAQFKEVVTGERPIADLNGFEYLAVGNLKHTILCIRIVQVAPNGHETLFPNDKSLQFTPLINCEGSDIREALFSNDNPFAVIMSEQAQSGEVLPV